MTDTTQTTSKQKKAYAKMAVAIGKYLEAMGWNVALVSGARIEKPFSYPKAKFQFSVDFLGAKNAD